MGARAVSVSSLLHPEEKKSRLDLREDRKLGGWGGGAGGGMQAVEVVTARWI